MRSESLNDQLRRIGGIATAALIAAAALGTFALLRRIIPAPAPGPAPQTVPVTKGSIIPTPAGTDAASASGADPLAAAQAQTAQETARLQLQQAQLARQREQAFNRAITAASRHRANPTVPIVRQPSGATRALSGGSKRSPSGGAGLPSK